MTSPYRLQPLLAAFLLLLGSAGFTQPAPVFDADSMFEPMASEQDLPPPPPPEQEGVFVPMQREARQPSRGEYEGRIPPTAMNLGDRLRVIEQQLHNLQNTDQNAKVDSLQDQLQSLRAEVEALNHKLKLLETSQKEASLDQHKADNHASESKVLSELREEGRLSQKPAEVKKTAEKKAPESQPNIAEEQKIYQTAYQLIKEKKFSDAAETLQGMLKKYPGGQFAANAHYWLGELYGVMGQNDQALREFTTVIKQFQESSRVPDAEFKLGLIYSTQSRWADAKSAFKRVVNKYPNSTSARLAKEQLKELKKAGH